MTNPGVCYCGEYGGGVHTKSARCVDQPSSNTKLYAERDIIAQGQTYCDHVMAMTAESLHSKSDIAAELAHRDIEIERLLIIEKLYNEQCDAGYARGSVLDSTHDAHPAESEERDYLIASLRQKHREVIQAIGHLMDDDKSSIYQRAAEYIERCATHEPVTGPVAPIACIHGMPLAENICGPCSQGRPNRAAQPPPTAPLALPSAHDVWVRCGNVKSDDVRTVMHAIMALAPRSCNHGAISPKGTMFYHGFVGPANRWRCDVCKGEFEGSLTKPGSQSLTLVSSSQPPAPDEAVRLRQFVESAAEQCNCADVIVDLRAALAGEWLYQQLPGWDANNPTIRPPETKEAKQ